MEGSNIYLQSLREKVSEVKTLINKRLSTKIRSLSYTVWYDLQNRSLRIEYSTNWSKTDSKTYKDSLNLEASTLKTLENREAN